ncbi:MAG: modified peptide precursor CbpA [Chloroflexi bacterium]|nr:modified peptide precursor CbpA [Chloroflexota bacterium]
MKKALERTPKDVIAYRKKCKPDGAGLSHYILMNKKEK